MESEGCAMNLLIDLLYFTTEEDIQGMNLLTRFKEGGGLLFLKCPCFPAMACLRDQDHHTPNTLQAVW